MSRKRRAGGAKVPLLVVALLLASIVLGRAIVHSVRGRFDSSVWRARPADGPNRSDHRQRMAGDVAARVLHPGMPRDSILSLLGPADPTSHFRDAALVYYLGPERSLISIDSEWLVLYLDANGGLVRAQVTTD